MHLIKSSRKHRRKLRHSREERAKDVRVRQN